MRYVRFAAFAAFFMSALCARAENFEIYLGPTVICDTHGQMTDVLVVYAIDGPEGAAEKAVSIVYEDGRHACGAYYVIGVILDRLDTFILQDGMVATIIRLSVTGVAGRRVHPFEQFTYYIRPENGG